VHRHEKNALVAVLILAGSAGGYMLTVTTAVALTTTEFGIDRSNLITQSEAVQEKTLQDIRGLHATGSVMCFSLRLNRFPNFLTRQNWRNKTA
jgi:hypothetical protein